MKKILVFHPYLTPYRLDLYNSLSDIYEMKVILTGSVKEKNTLGFDLEYVNSQAHFDYVYMQGGAYIGRHLVSSIYCRAIKNFKPDIVMAHELGINTFFSILLKRIFKFKLYVTIDDSPSMIRKYGRIRKMLQKFVVMGSDIILTVHPEVKCYLEKKNPGSDHEKFLFFPIIQDENRFAKKLKESELISDELSKLFSLQGKKVILFVGRMESIKGPDILLRLFLKIDPENTLLVFVGEGSQKKILQEKCNVFFKNRTSKVIFTGKLVGNQLYAWYRIANLFVLPSRFEPFGAVVNEALISGCYVITSNMVGASCLVDETNGQVFNIEDESEFEYILRQKLADIEQRTIKNRMNILFEKLAILIN